MKKFPLIIFILIISIVGLSACARNEEPVDEPPTPVEEPGNDESELPDESDSKTWPTTKDDTIELEGNREPITLNYFEGENFITYVPEDMIGEPYEIEDGDAYRFYTNFQGNKNSEIYMQILFYPEDMKEKPNVLGDAVDIVDKNNRYHDWALEEYVSQDGGLYGILGQHKDQYFSIVLNYNEDFAEGFVPRANKIIEHIYFTDTNEYLVEEFE